MTVCFINDKRKINFTYLKRWKNCRLQFDYWSKLYLLECWNGKSNLKRTLLQGGNQKNETEVGDNRKWNAVSVIEVAFSQVSRFR